MAAMTAARACRSLDSQPARSITLRLGRVRRGLRSGWTSRSLSSRDQCTMQPSIERLREPRGTTRCGREASNPSKPSRASADGPPSALPGGALASATSSRAAASSGPLCRTTTPRHGCCHRPEAIACRTTPRPNRCTAAALVKTSISADCWVGVVVTMVMSRVRGRLATRFRPVDGRNVRLCCCHSDLKVGHSVATSLTVRHPGHHDDRDVGLSVSHGCGSPTAGRRRACRWRPERGWWHRA